MRIKEHTGGYNLWLNKNDTYRWAHKTGASWPCSLLSGKSLFVAVDSNGLCDYSVNGKEYPDLSGDELTACVTDHLPEHFKQFWPVWKF